MLNKCEISKSESNLVVITKCQSFQERVILRCCLHSLISRQPRVEYKKAVNLAKLREDEDRSYLSLNLTRYTKVECLLVMPDETQRLLDSYTIELKL